MVFRSARHTNNLQVIIEFYTKVLHLEVLGSFEDHENYSGVFLGLSGENWHMEFTESEEKAAHIFDEDDILVFYPKSYKEYHAIVDCIEQKGIQLHEPKNPYWKANGIMIADPDGYRVVISNQKITH